MNNDDISVTYDQTDASESGDSRRPIVNEAIGRFPFRLKQVMGNTKAREFARKCGLSEGAIRSYLSGDTYPTLDRLDQIAEAAHSTALYLAFGLEAGFQPAQNDDRFAYVPLYDARCSSGHGAWNEGVKILTMLAFTRYSLQKKGLDPATLAAIQNDGDSMLGVLDDGDTVMLDRSRTTMQAEGIYVIRLDEHLYAKRLQLSFDGSVHIMSENKAYKDMVVPKERLGELEIVGRAVWAGGWLI